MIPDHIAGRWHNRERKVRHRRNRRLDAKTKSASYHLRGDGNGTHCFTAEITRHGLFPSLYLEIEQQIVYGLNTRRNIHEGRRQAARRSIEQVSSLVVERFAKHGARTIFGDGDPFKVPIREEDCFIIDDWQWVLNSSVVDQQLIRSAIDTYQDLLRWQIEKLLEQDEVVYYSNSQGWLMIRRRGSELLAPLAATMPVEAQAKLAALAA